MKSRGQKRLVVTILPAFLLIVGQVLAQDQTLSTAEREFAEIESKLADLGTQRETLSAQVRSHAVEIQELKSRDRLSYFQRQKLEALLKQSQTVSNQIESIDGEIRILDRNLTRAGETLIERYNSQIDRLLAKSQNSKLSTQARKNLLSEINTLRTKRAAVKQKIKPSSPEPVGLTRVEIEPDDSAKKITQKADLLKDQEDKLRRLVGQIAQQTQDMQKELRVRTRINEMVTDMAVFDPLDEAVGDVSALGAQALAEESRDLSATPEKNLGQSDDQFLIGRDFDITNLSSEQLEDAIEALENRQKQARAKADSLARQAERFYKAAQDRKKP